VQSVFYGTCVQLMYPSGVLFFCGVMTVGTCLLGWYFNVRYLSGLLSGYFCVMVVVWNGVCLFTGNFITSHFVFVEDF